MSLAFFLLNFFILHIKNDMFFVDLGLSTLYATSSLLKIHEGQGQRSYCNLQIIQKHCSFFLTKICSQSINLDNVDKAPPFFAEDRPVIKDLPN